ncbi:regulator of complement activation group 2 gene 1 isoform X2 [Halichoeres trimaculatus]|uniref:regulator of complement activation group 2 gene 1 isoform X2 n=1 Tax=Halichoeres trimaculatus TaxID=147232 RepID=UPI003D9E88A8
MTVKCFLLLSSLGLVLTAQAQDCGSPPLQPNMNLRDSDYSLTQFPDGTRVGYTCAIGYISAGGSPTIVCTSGTWSSLALKCERKNCGSAGEVLNGEVQYPQEGTEFGDSAVVVCNTGFRLVGRSTLNCGDKGWMGRLPECEVVSCDPPDPIEGGTYRDVKDSYEYREVIRYTCQKDLTLMGSSTLTCSEDGVFTPDPPTCSRHECDKPNIDNAQRLGGYKPTYKYKDTVRHQCNSGYKMIGESTSVCELDGWTPKLMTCEAKNCSKPAGGSDMSLEDTEGVSQIFLHGSSATFVCNNGYEPTGGSAVIKCTAGAWSVLMLKCKPKSCSKPVGGSNMTLDKDSVSQVYPHHSSATFVCNKGYEPESGSRVIKCTTGVWSLLTLKCKKTDEEGTGGEGGTDKEGTDGEEGNSGNNTGRNVGIGVGATAGCAAAAGGGMYYKKKKKEGKHSSPVCPTLLDVKTSA